MVRVVHFSEEDYEFSVLSNLEDWFGKPSTPKPKQEEPVLDPEPYVPSKVVIGKLVKE